jgi:type II secretory pathway component PulM
LKKPSAKAGFRQWCPAQERERWILGLGALVVVLTLAFLLIDPLFSGVSARAQRVAEKEVTLAMLQRTAATLPKAGATQAQTSPNVVIEKTAKLAGLRPTQTQPVGDNGARTQFDAVDADALIAWIETLAREHGLRVDSAEFHPSGRAGAIDARLTFDGS